MNVVEDEVETRAARMQSLQSLSDWRSPCLGWRCEIRRLNIKRFPRGQSVRFAPCFKFAQAEFAPGGGSNELQRKITVTQ